MGFGSLLDRLMGRKRPVALPEDAARMVDQMKRASGKAPEARKSVVVITTSHEIRLYLVEHLKPAIEALRYEYNEHPNLDAAVSAGVLLLDVRPEVDARVHQRYEQILVAKKSLRRNDDIIALFGPRSRHTNYPRGSYPPVLYFCVPPLGLEDRARERDLPPTGLETMEGPRLFNFNDVVPAVTARIRERLRPQVKL